MAEKEKNSTQKEKKIVGFDYVFEKLCYSELLPEKLGKYYGIVSLIIKP